MNPSSIMDASLVTPHTAKATAATATERESVYIHASPHRHPPQTRSLITSHTNDPIEIDDEMVAVRWIATWLERRWPEAGPGDFRVQCLHRPSQQSKRVLHPRLPAQCTWRTRINIYLIRLNMRCKSGASSFRDLVSPLYDLSFTFTQAHTQASMRARTFI